MIHEIRLPAVGASAVGEVSEWYKAPEQSVTAGEPIVAVDIDKVLIDVPAPADGVLTVVVPEGQTVETGGVLGWITARSDEG
ncbi:MAG: sucB [Acidimicrobiaceae bacterium]|nr:sucB [Acidimicrobiaceae bacterium]